jgi:hypothetical protein
MTNWLIVPVTISIGFVVGYIKGIFDALEGEQRTGEQKAKE